MTFDELREFDAESVLLNLDEFAETISYKGVDIRAVVDFGPDLAVDLPAGGSADAVITVSRADVPLARNADEVVIRGNQWLAEYEISSDGYLVDIAVRRKETMRFT